ncbi:MAG: MFS transporter [Thermoleophilia bacterium]
MVPFAVPGVLRVSDFRRFWVASLISNCGSWLQVVAAGWLVQQLTHSPAAVGALALVARGPAFVLSVAGGQLADRFPRRLVGIWTFAVQGAASAAMALLAWSGHLGLWSIYVLTFALGVGFALGLPAMLAMVPALVPHERLSQAVSLNAAGINMARFVGPALGGALFDLAGPTWCFTVNSTSFLALVLVLMVVRPREPAAGATAVPLGAALRVAWHDPAIRRLLVGMMGFAAFAAPTQELAPVVADALHAGPSGLGMLLGAMGCGALLGAWLLDMLQRRGLRRGTALPLATLIFGVGMCGVAAAPVFPLALGAMAFCGAFWIWLFIATNTSVQLRAPHSMMGRMLGFYQLSVVGPIAIGSMGAGALAGRVGIHASLALCAAVLVAAGAWGLLHPVPEIDGTRAPEPGVG